MTHAHMPQAFRLVALCLAGLVCTGCAVINRSSLASNTGPASAGGDWSAAAEQWVHVGEKVDFSYAVSAAGADYAILQIRPLNISKVSLVAEAGRFYFDGLTFKEPTPPQRPLIAKASAYRERGERDHMDLDGQLLSRESPGDMADALISFAQIKLHVYQSNIAMQVPVGPAEYRWETARLTIHGQPDLPAEIQPDRPYRKGFRVTGPGVAGTFLVTYEPTPDQIRRAGTTRVVLTVLDAKGQEYCQELFLPTP